MDLDLPSPGKLSEVPAMASVAAASIDERYGTAAVHEEEVEGTQMRRLDHGP